MMTDAGAFCAELRALLEAHDIPDAAFDVRCMVEQVAGKRLESVLFEEIPEKMKSLLRQMAQRRISGEPLQYILGEWEFFGMRLFVGNGVLIPRPDTETLVEAVLDWCKGREQPKILDLCTGSGCIALALKKCLPSAQVHGIDLSREALAYAERNAAYHHLDVTFHRADVLAAEGSFADVSPDVIVSNPPYLNATEMASLQTELRSEPALALDGGDDGLRFYRRMTALWKGVLKRGGLLAYEIGETQGTAVPDILEANGFRQVRVLKDYAGRDRVVLGEFFPEQLQ